MGVRDTSKETYQDILASGLVTGQHKLILDFLIENHPIEFTNREIAISLNMEPSTVSARRNELMEAGVMEESGKKKCSVSNRKAYTWKLTPKTIQTLNIKGVLLL